MNPTVARKISFKIITAKKKKMLLKRLKQKSKKEKDNLLKSPPNFLNLQRNPPKITRKTL